MKTSEFLRSTHAKLQGLRAARSAYASQFAPDFNVIDLLAPNEVRLSNVLRELLDPNGSHAQGRKFLDIFIQLLKLPDWAANRKVLSVVVEVCTEFIQQSERRIDILIELEGPTKGRNLAIAIENKPWAADGDHQIADYLDHLALRYRDGYALIYLPGHKDCAPAGHSIEKEAATTAIEEKRLFMSSYAQLLPWLDECRKQCEAPSVHAFLQSFEQYIRQTFMGITDMTERKQLIADAIDSPKTVEIALELSLAQTDIQQALIDRLESQLTNGIKEKGHSWKVIGDIDVKKTQGFFHIQLNPGDQYNVSFELFQPGAGANFGIRSNVETEEDLPDVRASLDIEFNAKGKQWKGWPWCQEFEESLRDWRYSSKPWVQVASGEMAEWMIETVRRIDERLTKAELKFRLTGNGTRLFD